MKRIMILALSMMFLLSVAACGKTEVPAESSTTAGGLDSLTQMLETKENTEAQTDAAEDKQQEDEAESSKVGTFDFERKTVLLNSGYEMPIMGLGTYSLDHDTCVSSVKALLESGGRLIDTAYMYVNDKKPL